MSEPIRAFPLQWPADWPRTASAARRVGKFLKRESQRYNNEGRAEWRRALDLTIADGVRRVLVELERFGVARDDVVISTNAEPRLDGLPKSDRRVDDPGAAVYWRDLGTTRVIAVDLYQTLADNLAAIAATLEAMRAIERHGGARILERAFAGFAALPSPEALRSPRPWREVLNLQQGPVIPEAIEASYRAKARHAHPDRGGSHEAMVELNRAREEALRAIGAA